MIVCSVKEKYMCTKKHIRSVKEVFGQNILGLYGYWDL